MYKHKNFFCAQKAGFRIKLERIETIKRGEKEGGRDRKKWYNTEKMLAKFNGKTKS